MSEQRILTTHVGSLIRPPAIIERMRAYEAGEAVDDASFERELSGGVIEVVRKQAEIGIDVPSDGEFGKRGWTQYVTERLSGMEYLPGRTARTAAVTAPDNDRFGDFYREYSDFERTLWLPPETVAKMPPGGSPIVPRRATGW